MKKTIFVVDSNVLGFYKDKLSPYRLIEIGPGEGQKTLITVDRIYDVFFNGRSTVLRPFRCWWRDGL